MLVTVDNQKAFDSVNHQFLTLALRRYGFDKTFIKCIKALGIMHHKWRDYNKVFEIRQRHTPR